MNELPKTGFLRLEQVLIYIPVGKSTWWAGIKAGRFPKGIKLGPNTTAWRAEDIQALISKFGWAIEQAVLEEEAADVTQK